MASENIRASCSPFTRATRSVPSDTCGRTAQRGELIDANRQLDFRRRFSEAVLSGA